MDSSAVCDPVFCVRISLVLGAKRHAAVWLSLRCFAMARRGLFLYATQSFAGVHFAVHFSLSGMERLLREDKSMEGWAPILRLMANLGSTYSQEDVRRAVGCDVHLRVDASEDSSLIRASYGRVGQRLQFDISGHDAANLFYGLRRMPPLQWCKMTCTVASRMLEKAVLST